MSLGEGSSRSDPNPSSLSLDPTPNPDETNDGNVTDQLSPIQPSPNDDVSQPSINPEDQAQALHTLSSQHEESLASIERLQEMLNAERLKNTQLENQLAKGLDRFLCYKP